VVRTDDVPQMEAGLCPRSAWCTVIMTQHLLIRFSFLNAACYVTSLAVITVYKEKLIADAYSSDGLINVTNDKSRPS
jgi:hypothetical protein